MSRQPAYEREGGPARFVDLHPDVAELRSVVLEGLRRPQKTLPCGLLYDRRGSELFEAITRLPEYYLTRCETAVLRRYAAAIARLAGAGCTLIEYGSGSGAKVRALLDELPDAAAYVAVDISRAALRATVAELTWAYPALPLVAVCADYNRPFELPPVDGEGRRLVLFLGSTIGNLEPGEAAAFLRRTAGSLRAGDGLLVGADLAKDPQVLHAAYNDAAGVTAAFNLNLLRHLRERLGAGFDPGGFEHRAFYDARLGRVEMHLVSRRAQSVLIGAERVAFRAGETIHTENSYKYTLEGFRGLAAGAGLRPERCWTDARGWFSVHYLAVP